MNYPNGSNKKKTTTITYGNRGMSLEDDLNVTNEYYNANGIAVIHKKPTPITICQVEYLNRQEAVIREAKFKIPSTTDYNGIYKGKYIDFEAKETSNKTSFPLQNIHVHQLDHLRNVVAHGGIGFLIVRFTATGETFYLDSGTLFSFLDRKERKSIPYSYFKEKGVLIPIGLRPRLDYLKTVEVET